MIQDLKQQHFLSDAGALNCASGAEEVNRTPDLLITNQLLYQLSYFGFFTVFKESTEEMQVYFPQIYL